MHKRQNIVNYMPVRSGKVIISFFGLKIEFLQGKALIRGLDVRDRRKLWAATLPPIAEGKHKIFDSLSIVLMMRDRSGHKKHRCKSMAGIRLICPYRRI